MTYQRKTLAEAVRLDGIGLHTGVPVEVTIHPSQDGIAFRYGSTRTPARPENVTDTTRSTKVGEVGTVEHLMSALAALEITDAEIEVTAPEIPGVDGSSAPFLILLQSAGVEEIGQAEVGTPFKRVFLQEVGTKIAIGKGTGHWKYTFHIDGRWPGEQSFELEDLLAHYAVDVAPARTFALAEEVPAILQMGLAKGLDENSALILGIEGYKNEPRFDDEPARHKLLDLIGDLYLAGIPVRMLNVSAERSGHASNVRAAALLSQAAAASH